MLATRVIFGFGRRRQDLCTSPKPCKRPAALLSLSRKGARARAWGRARSKRNTDIDTAAMAANDNDHGARFDEDLGGPRDSNNYICFPARGAMATAMSKAWPLSLAGAHAPGYVKVPSIYVEKLFRFARVKNPPISGPSGH